MLKVVHDHVFRESQKSKIMIYAHLTVWGLLCEAAMWRTVQPLLSRMGEAEPPSLRFTMDSALDKQSRAMSEITSYYYLKLFSLRSL